MAKFEAVPLSDVRPAVPAEVVEEMKRYVDELNLDQAGRLTLEKGEDPKALRKAVRAAAAALGRRVRFPRTSEKGVVTFYLLEIPKRRGRAPGAKTRRRGGRPTKKG